MFKRNHLETIIEDQLTNEPCNSIRSNSDEFFDLFFKLKYIYIENDEELLTVQLIFAPYLKYCFSYHE
jgi:hypothetical protein